MTTNRECTSSSKPSHQRACSGDGWERGEEKLETHGGPDTGMCFLGAWARTGSWSRGLEGKLDKE